jgi:hypothetical protein
VTLNDQLKKIVNHYFERYPHMSINGLAQKSGVGATTLRRLINSTGKGEPAPHVVLGLVSATSKEKRLSQLVTMFDGEVGELLKKSFAPYIEKDMPQEIDQDLNEVLADQISYFIYKLSANREGTDKMEISDLYGKAGLERFTKLLKLGFVYLDPKKIRIHAKKKDFSLDVKIAADHLPEMMKFYKPNQISQGKNLFYTLSESINEEGVQKIKEVQKEAVKKVFDIMRSPFYEGKIPYFTVQVCDTLSHDVLSEGVLQ